MVERWRRGAGVGDDGKVLDYNAERARLTHHQANIAKLDEEVKLGTLVPIDDVRGFWQNLFASSRSRLMAIPARLASVCVGLGPAEMEEQARKIINEAIGVNWQRGGTEFHVVDRLSAALSIWAPPPELTVTQWADEFRRLSSEASAEPGRWCTARAPYQQGIMDAMHDPDIHTIVIMSSAQVGKSEILLNIVGYYAHQDPAPILIATANTRHGRGVQ